MLVYLDADKVLNDGAWTGLRVGKGTLEAEFVSVNAVHYRLQVGKVFAATTFGFGLRNTVEGIYTEQITPESVAGVIEEFRKASSGRQLLGEDLRIRERILREGLALLVVEPSEGGGLLVICDSGSIKLVQVNEDTR